MNLLFDVNGQSITRKDFNKVIAGSKNFLKAKFAFNKDWNKVEYKTATFIIGDSSEKGYEVLLDKCDMCLVPWEVLAESGKFYVSVFGGDLITVNKARIDVEENGMINGIVPEEPTEDIYNQILNELSTKQEKITAVEPLKLDSENNKLSLDDTRIDTIEETLSPLPNKIIALETKSEEFKNDLSSLKEKVDNVLPHPTKLSEFTNDTRFIAQDILGEYVKKIEIPTKLSEFENDLDKIYVPKKLSEFEDDVGLSNFATKQDVQSVNASIPKFTYNIQTGKLEISVNNQVFSVDATADA